jgi:DNA replication protein DnaC
MNATQFERLQEQLSRLRLIKSRERLEALLQEATSEQLSHADFLDRLLERKWSPRRVRTSVCGPTWRASPS